MQPASKPCCKNIRMCVSSLCYISLQTQRGRTEEHQKRRGNPLFYHTNLSLYLWYKLEIFLWNSGLFIGQLPPCMPILQEVKYLPYMDRSWEKQSFTLCSNQIGALPHIYFSFSFLASWKTVGSAHLLIFAHPSKENWINQYQIFLAKEPRSNP